MWLKGASHGQFQHRFGQCEPGIRYASDMTWISWLLIAIALTIVLLLAAFLIARSLQKHEPYNSVLKLRTRQKLRLLKALVKDGRVPKVVRALPFLLGLYLAIPIDIIPDFIPVLGYLDDVVIIVITLALMVRLTPTHLIEEHVSQIRANDLQLTKDE